jgi:hypothetical protein
VLHEQGKWTKLLQLQLGITGFENTATVTTTRQRNCADEQGNGVQFPTVPQTYKKTKEFYRFRRLNDRYRRNQRKIREIHQGVVLSVSVTKLLVW